MIKAGDRVRLHETGDNAPVWLLSDLGTVMKVNRTRAVVKFDIATMSRAINMSHLRPASWKPSDGWNGWQTASK